MNDIPAKLECAYCKRNVTHGGPCRPSGDEKGCLYFLRDPLGCIRSTSGRIPFALFSEIPPLNVWSSDWSINGYDTKVMITHVKGLSWDTKNGYLYVYADYKYFYDDFENKINEKVNLKVIDEDGNIIDTLYIKLDGIITDNEDIERMTVEELTKKHYPVTDNVEIE